MPQRAQCTWLRVFDLSKSRLTEHWIDGVTCTQLLSWHTLQISIFVPIEFRMTSRFIRQWLVLGGIWLLFGAAIGLNLYTDYNSTESNERERLTGLSRVVDENIQVQLGATHEALKSIRADLALLKAQRDNKSLINLRLKAMTDAMVGVRSLFILDANGVVTASSRADLLGKGFHSREYFRDPLKDPNPDRLFLSHPFRSSLGDITMTLTKTLQSQDGGFNGVIVAALDPAYFGTMLNSALYAPDMRATLFDGDGDVFVSTPSRGNPGQLMNASGGLLAQHLATGEDSSVLKGWVFASDEPRLSGFRTNRFNTPPLDRPLIVALDRDEQSVFSEWRKGCYAQAAVSLGLLLISVIGVVLFQRRLHAFDVLVSGQDLARQKSELRINELAFNDQLTGLANRTLLLDRLNHAFVASSRSGEHGALMLIDVDDFKTLNETLGHGKGDLLLKMMAEALTANVREGDTVARSGGDEFVVIIGALSKKEKTAANSIEAIAEKVLHSLNQTFRLGDDLYSSSVSIGITLFRGESGDADSLMKQVELAMYKAKESGRNTLRFFNPEMELAVVERARKEADLRMAVQENQFVAVYQAQVVGDGRVTGAEALVRWNHPERGLVSPAEFIPLAEETGLILEIGRFMLRTACEQLAVWVNQPNMTDLILAVNVSAQEFRAADFVEMTVAILVETGANPTRLKLELTESLLVDNLEDVVTKMFLLKSKGVGFSLDDFGTGYSSLAYLKRLPLDQLKIDQSFVRDVLSDQNDAVIAKTIVALAQSLGFGVIAEGVETEEQRQFLAGSGCHFYQGYLFSRPLALVDFERLVESSAVR